MSEEQSGRQAARQAGGLTEKWGIRGVRSCLPPPTPCLPTPTREQMGCTACPSVHHSYCTGQHTSQATTPTSGRRAELHHNAHSAGNSHLEGGQTTANMSMTCCRSCLNPGHSNKYVMCVMCAMSPFNEGHEISFPLVKTWGLLGHMNKQTSKQMQIVCPSVFVNDFLWRAVCER